MTTSGRCHRPALPSAGEPDHQRRSRLTRSAQDPVRILVTGRIWSLPVKQLRCARVISAGHALVQNIRRGYYELGVEEPTTVRVAAAFTELVLAI